MKILKRIKQQTDVVKELRKEPQYESNYRGLERRAQLTIQALLDLVLMVLSRALTIDKSSKTTTLEPSLINPSTK